MMMMMMMMMVYGISLYASILRFTFWGDGLLIWLLIGTPWCSREWSLGFGASLAEVVSRIIVGVGVFLGAFMLRLQGLVPHRSRCALPHLVAFDCSRGDHRQEQTGRLSCHGESPGSGTAVMTLL